MSEHNNEPLPPDLLSALKTGRPGNPVPSEDRDYLVAALGPLMWPSLPIAASPPSSMGSKAEPPLPKAQTSTASIGMHGLISGKAATTTAGILAGAVLGVLGHVGVERLSSTEKVSHELTQDAGITLQQIPSPYVSSTPEIASTDSSTPDHLKRGDETTEGANSAPLERVGGNSIPSAMTDEGRTRARDESLNAERALVDAARTALSRGQANAAMDALTRHQQRFPRGRLAEERDALWVQALGLAGQERAAREKADLFRKQYPGSLMTPNAAPSSDSR